jgi:cytochrome d ubiquinol oxidase subunit I
VTTEVGRQPWTVVGLLLTRDAAATSGNLWLFFGGTLVLYAAVGYGTFLALRLLRTRWRAGAGSGGEGDVPYGPSRVREEETAGAGGGGG